MNFSLLSCFIFAFGYSIDHPHSNTAAIVSRTRLVVSTSTRASTSRFVALVGLVGVVIRGTRATTVLSLNPTLRFCLDKIARTGLVLMAHYYPARYTFAYESLEHPGIDARHKLTPGLPCLRFRRLMYCRSFGVLFFTLNHVVTTDLWNCYCYHSGTGYSRLVFFRAIAFAWHVYLTTPIFCNKSNPRTNPPDILAHFLTSGSSDGSYIYILFTT